MSVWLAASVLLGFAIGLAAGVGFSLAPFLQIGLAIVAVYGVLWAVDWINEQVSE